MSGNIPDALVDICDVSDNISDALVNIFEVSGNAPDALVNICDASDNISDALVNICDVSGNAPDALVNICDVGGTIFGRARRACGSTWNPSPACGQTSAGLPMLPRMLPEGRAIWMWRVQGGGSRKEAVRAKPEKWYRSKVANAPPFTPSAGGRGKVVSRCRVS